MSKARAAVIGLYEDASLCRQTVDKLNLDVLALDTSALREELDSIPRSRHNMKTYVEALDRLGEVDRAVSLMQVCLDLVQERRHRSGQVVDKLDQADEDQIGSLMGQWSDYSDTWKQTAVALMGSGPMKAGFGAGAGLAIKGIIKVIRGLAELYGIWSAMRDARDAINNLRDDDGDGDEDGDGEGTSDASSFEEPTDPGEVDGEDEGDEDDEDDGLTIVETDLEFRRDLTRRGATNAVVLHHAASAGGRDISAEEIHRDHLQRQINEDGGDGEDNLWSGIGYHYVIRTDGTIERGRPEDTQGAHAQGRNWDSVGICFAGDYDASQPEQEQMDRQFEAALELIEDIQGRHGGDLDVAGHGDVGDSACPGQHFDWGRIREQYPAPDEE